MAIISYTTNTANMTLNNLRNVLTLTTTWNGIISLYAVRSLIFRGLGSNRLNNAVIMSKKADLDQSTATAKKNHSASSFGMFVF